MKKIKKFDSPPSIEEFKSILDSLPPDTYIVHYHAIFSSQKSNLERIKRVDYPDETNVIPSIPNREIFVLVEYIEISELYEFIAQVYILMTDAEFLEYSFHPTPLIMHN